MTTDTSTSTVESIDAEMLRSMAASFRSGLGFSFNGQDMAEVLDRAHARLTLPDDAALDALVAALHSRSNWAYQDGAMDRAAQAITALRAQNAALQAEVTAQALDAMALETADEIVAMVPDPRPADCRFRLQDEGKPYPKSGCAACGCTIGAGLGKVCALAGKEAP